MAVSKRLRYEILRRDGNACRYCGNTAPDVPLTVDHVIPVALGGSDEPENLVTACGPCNSGKSSSSPDAPLVADVAEDALRWAQAMQMAAARAAENYAKRAKIASGLGEAWRSLLGPWAEGAGYFLPRDWEHSIYQFIDAGLTFEDLGLRMHYTLTRPNVPDDALWRYFCGTCWKIVRERQHEAAALIQEGVV